MTQALSSTQRKRLQRQRDRALGWTEISVRIAREHTEVLRSFAATLPPPTPPKDPRQLDLIAQLESQLQSGTSNQEELF